MRYTDLRDLIMAKLGRWKRMTVSDLLAALPAVERARFDEAVLQTLVQDGLVRVALAGDEIVATITDRGEDWLRQRRQHLA